MFHCGDAVAVNVPVYAVERAGICIGEILVEMAERNLLRSKCVSWFMHSHHEWHQPMPAGGYIQK